MNTIHQAIRLFTMATAFTGVLSAKAAGEGPEKSHGSASTAEVSYIGSQDESPIFHVHYNNSTGARFSIRVLDADGHQIYQGIFHDKKFDKKFMIANPELTGRMVFIIRNLEDKSVQNFQVDSDTRMIEDVEVKEVK